MHIGILSTAVRQMNMLASNSNTKRVESTLFLICTYMYTLDVYVYKLAHVHVLYIFTMYI